MRFPLVLPVALALVATQSCETPTALSPEPGVYVLESLAGQPLPVVTVENAVARQRLIADTLRLEIGNEGTRVQWSSIEALVEEFSTPSPVRIEWPIRLVRREGALRAAEEVGCAQAVATEPCESLWDQPVTVTGERLRVGLRWYRRVAAP
jgi:hypothetical protein